ncbi:hypothetical protein F5878DRAFT_722539 [Lentinula raphanica]|uniref:F-box domain-containing protein n=1 Tax=Lentinula raphanica TaxID=153919 RepID=A0AA38UI95_9AGAR|nr:hypothetical protein F5878DRAFT_722539 [Lentinula raphanica]
MKELPSEIWLHIASFIPDATLKRLTGVNLLFYNISMDLRYKSIVLQRLDSRTMMLLKRLSDPAVGKRVRLLTASPDFRFYGAVHAPPSSSFRHFLHPFRLLGYGSGPNNSNKPRPEEEGTRALIIALPAMPNVTTFTIDSHSWGQHSGTRIQDFLNTAWASFGSNLRKLSLRGHAASFRTIIGSTPSLPQVEELFFELTDNPTSSVMSTEDDRILINVFAPFINSFSPKLQALTIWAWTSLDLSAFFRCLGQFPLLTCFNFQTSFLRTFKHDPSSLSHFIQQHCAQLEILVLKLNQNPVLHTIQMEQPLSEWIYNTFQESHFSHLLELQLYPSALPRGFDGLLTCIQSSAKTIHTLVVRDRYLDAQDVSRLIDILPSNTKSLRLNVLEMDIHLYDSLSTRLPELRSLSLYISKVLPDLPVTIILDLLRKLGILLTSDTLQTFISNINTRKYIDWKLRDIGVWQSGYNVSHDLMSALRNSIPSVVSFWGLGNIEPDLMPYDSVIDWSTRNIDDGIQ